MLAKSFDNQFYTGRSSLSVLLMKCVTRPSTSTYSSATPSIASPVNGPRASQTASGRRTESAVPDPAPVLYRFDDGITRWTADFHGAIGSTPFERGDEAEDFLIVTAAADKGLVDIQRRDFRHWGEHPAGCATNRMRYAIRATSSLKNH